MIQNVTYNAMYRIQGSESVTRNNFYKKWQTKNISVAFGSFFTYQVKEATESLLLLLGDYLLQPSKAKRAADWNHAGASGSINRYTGKFDTALL